DRDARVISPPILELQRIYKRFGDTIPANDVSLSIAAGEFFTLLGPSGSGKSTILRIIAGLERADSGGVLLDGRDVSQTPPWKRHLGMVFQQYANFPHMDAGENIAYGLRRSGLSNADIAARVGDLLDLVGLQGFQHRRVTQLSGGEQQRVAIARALAPRPALLLLDEPLSALDEKIRREMQGELRNIQQTTATTFVYVTHDQEEALTMSDRIAVLNHGKCVQCDAPEHIFRHPRTRFVASFFRGCNVLEARLERDNDIPTLEVSGARVRLPAGPAKGEGPRPIAIRGEVVYLGADAQRGDIVLTSRLKKITYRGVYSDYRLCLTDGQELSATLTQRHDIRVGEDVLLGVRAEDIVILDED
ncbi:MAG: ABC transporter ATP-binding protein, partial [Burkholderiales bacterium]